MAKEPPAPKKGEAPAHEFLRAGGIYYKEAAPALYKETAESFYIVKGVIESVFDRLRVEGYSFSLSAEPFLHPGKSADVYMKDVRVGWMGVLLPEVIERFNIKSRPEVLLFELDMDAIASFIPTGAVYSAIPKYPPVERDIAIVLDPGAAAGDVIRLIKSYPTEFIEDVFVFDTYTGPNIPQGKKSLAFGIRYRAKDHTLTDSEVETLHSALVKHLTEKTGGEIRGGS